jgi:hypothetical protein
MFIYFQTFGDACCLHAIKGARGESVNKRLLTSIEHVSQAFPHALVSARSESLPPLSRCRYVDLEICMAGTGSRVKKRTKRGVVGNTACFVLSPMFSVPLVPVAARGAAGVDPRQHTW